MAGIYANDNPRNRSQLIWNGDVLRDDAGNPRTFNAETIGQPIRWGPYFAAAGENGHLIYAINGQVKEHSGLPLRFASACAVWNNVPVVINADEGKNRVLDCFAGVEIGTLPGSGIVLAAAEYSGYLWGAMADSEDERHGLACSSGLLIEADSCQCVVVWCGRLFFTSGNRVLDVEGGAGRVLGELPCEKIMDMRVIDNNLRIAGANPDSVWDVRPNGDVLTVGTMAHGNAKVGGSCFRVRASENYFARCINGTQGEVVRIK